MTDRTPTEADIENLIERLLDAQQDINLAANQHMSQPLCDASAVIDEVEKTLRRLAASPAAPGAEVEPRPSRGGAMMRKDCDYVEFGDYQSDMRDQASVALSIIAKVCRQRDEAERALNFVVLAAGGEVRIPHHIFRQNPRRLERTTEFDPVNFETIVRVRATGDVP